ncbi:hypothetical protein Q9L58_008087 [Maublancomyces gigas]|uniref:Uncharacterized protein n=1 Tax=Discina gigas TaxID=1032678 RepID=A0ABR3GB75_9PEZI
MSSPSDPSAIPLPPGDDTAYFNTPQSSGFAATPSTRNHKMHDSDVESTPQTTRALPPFRHPNSASSVYSNMNTPTPAGMLGSDIETPRGRPQRRGGKYHPGVASTQKRDENLGSGVSEPSQSSGPDSGSDEEEELVAGLENAKYRDLSQAAAANLDNQTSVPLNMNTPLQRQYPGLDHLTGSRRTTRRSSLDQTPARKLLTNSKNFFTATPVAYQKNTATFMNPDILPSAFSEDAVNFPSLSAATPHKLNTIQGSPAGINSYQLSVENSQLSTQIREKDSKIRYLEEMLSGGQPQNFDDFFDFSPEKKMKLSPIMTADAAPPLTIKKRRQSPTKAAFSARKTRGSRYSSRSPVKSSLSLFESIATPVRLSVKERKEERRRRETREFREFSAIDLEVLKSYLPPVGVEKMEDEIKVSNVNEAPKCPTKDSGESMKVEKVQPDIEISKPKVSVPPSPVCRTRLRRSNSAPPVPISMDNKASILSSTKPAFLQGTASIATLQTRVTQLEEDLEVASINLQKAVAALEGERRARISAEETWHFLETERKFGVCCYFAQAAGKTATESAVAVPLPSSPVESVRSVATNYTERHPSKYSTRPASRMQSERPESRMQTDRPSSRMQIDRPSSRMNREMSASHMERGYGNSTSKIGAAPTVSATAGKKRPREESANSGIAMRKAPVPRQAEKKVLGGVVGAANVPLGGGATATGGILKKPALGAGVGAPPMKAPVRAISGIAAGTRSMTGLARGAKR